MVNSWYLIIHKSMFDDLDDGYASCWPLSQVMYSRMSGNKASRLTCSHHEYSTCVGIIILYEYCWNTVGSVAYGRAIVHTHTHTTGGH